MIVERLPIWTRFSRSDVVFDPIKTTFLLEVCREVFRGFHLVAAVAFYKAAIRPCSALLENTDSAYFKVSLAPAGTYIYSSTKPVQIRLFFPQRITQMIIAHGLE